MAPHPNLSLPDPSAEEELFAIALSNSLQDVIQTNGNDEIRAMEASVQDQRRQSQADKEVVAFYKGEKRSADSAEGSKSAAPPIETSTSPAPSPKKRVTIEDRIKQLELKEAHLAPASMPWPSNTDGDTYLFIDPAPQQPEQTYEMYRQCVKRYEKPIVIRSSILRDLKSDFFNGCLDSATYQFRVCRRRGLVPLPDGIEFVVDLTPPADGDEAAWLMTELCCVEGVKKWYQGHSRWCISNTLIGGQDDFCIGPVQVSADLNDEQNSSELVPELSHVRHRSSIERVLHAIQGYDPQLDSAPKVYTTAAVARYFDIRQSPLTDYLVRWLRATPNSLFIEALPDITLRIADGIRCYELIRDSFGILVGEEALAIKRESDPVNTVYGRKKYDVPDSYKTRIEYASKSFHARISKCFDQLVAVGMGWIDRLPEFQKLQGNDETFNQTKNDLKAYVRGGILKLLWSDILAAPSVDLGKPGGDDLYPRVPQEEFWGWLKPEERLMTFTFWRLLGDISIFEGTSNLSSPEYRVFFWNLALSHDNREILKKCYGVREIFYFDLQHLSGLCRDYSMPPAHSTTISAEISGQDYEREPLGDLPCSLQSFNVGSSEYQGTQGCYSEDNQGAYFNLSEFRHQVKRHLENVCSEMMRASDFNRGDITHLEITPTLVCLDQLEWKYLPLYAGGDDDESGGVFNDEVPYAEAGFSTAGPIIHTGTGSSAASSEYEVVGRGNPGSSHNTSTVANGSFSDQSEKKAMSINDDDLWAEVRGSDSSVTDRGIQIGTLAAPSTQDNDSEADTRYWSPSTISGIAHKPSTQDPGEELGEDKGKEATSEEDYDDLFSGSGVEEDDDDSDENSDTETVKYDSQDDDDRKVEHEHEDSEDEDLIIL